MFLFYFFFPMSQFDRPTTQKIKIKLWSLPRIERSILNYKVPPLWPSSIGERRTTFAKAYGIKVRCYGENVGEHIGNLGNILGTHWELKRNTLGTREKWKKSFPTCPPPPQTSPPPKLERKKSKAPWLHAWAFPSAAWNFSSQESITIFGLG